MSSIFRNACENWAASHGVHQRVASSSKKSLEDRTWIRSDGVGYPFGNFSEAYRLASMMRGTEKDNAISGIPNIAVRIVEIGGNQSL